MIKIDTYTKVVLTIIAIALCAIAIKLFNPQLGSNGSPTFGDFMEMRQIKDPQQRKETRSRLLKSLPLVRIEGGQVDADVSGSVTFDN
jgi:hypothetical protein